MLQCRRFSIPTTDCASNLRECSAVKLGVHKLNSTVPRLLLGLLMVFAPFFADVPCCCAQEVFTSALGSPKAYCCAARPITGHNTAQSCCQSQKDASGADHRLSSCCQIQSAFCECALASESLPVSQLRRHSVGQQRFVVAFWLSAEDALNVAKRENAGRSPGAGLITSSPSNRRQARLSVWRN